MTAYTFHVHCPLCAAPVAHQATGERPGMEQHAVARCEPCGRVWGVSLYMRDVTEEIRRPRQERRDLAAENEMRRARKLEAA